MSDQVENRGSIQWVLDLMEKSPSLSAQLNRHRAYNLGKRFNVRICNTCDKVWDFVRDGHHYSVRFLAGFPRYRLTKKTCFICNPKSKTLVAKNKPVRIVK